MPIRRNAYINTGGRASGTFQSMTWGKPEGEGFNDDFVSSITDDPSSHPIIVTWTLGVGADLSTGVNLTPFFRIPENGVIKNARAVSKTIIPGTTCIFDINHSTDPAVAGSSIFVSTADRVVIASGQYESAVYDTLRIRRINEDDILTIDCDQTAASIRDVTVVLEIMTE